MNNALWGATARQRQFDEDMLVQAEEHDIRFAQPAALEETEMALLYRFSWLD